MKIDWWTLALQAVNAAVLIWLLAHFLFRPRSCENVFPPRKTARNRWRSTSTRPFEHVFAVASL
jgi:hypothetical protein